MNREYFDNVIFHSDCLHGLQVLLLFGACLAVLAGCNQSPVASTSGDKMRVVCSTTIIADMVHQLAGEDAEVIGLMKPGEDPHVYEVRPRDAQQIAAAELVLINGLHLESTLLRVIENNARGMVVALAEDPRIQPLVASGGLAAVQSAPDPHCWFNLEYFRVYVERARDALAAADPAHADAYRRRAERYVKQVDQLHSRVKEQLAEVPAERRVIVTSHDAFAYYGQAYEVEVHAVVGVSTEQQPRPQDIVQLEELVRSRGVKALFIETSVNQTLNDLVERVAFNTGARIGGALYSDSLGTPDTDAGSFLGMVRYNTQTIVEALK